jgi:hypothetical protein
MKDIAFIEAEKLHWKDSAGGVIQIVILAYAWKGWEIPRKKKLTAFAVSGTESPHVHRQNL